MAIYLGRNRKMAVAVAFNGDIIAWGSTHGATAREQMNRFDDAVQAELGRMAPDYKVYVEGGPYWMRYATTITARQLGMAAFIINA